MANMNHDNVRAIEWDGKRLRLLDQRILPQRKEYIECRNSKQVADAISDMVVRGAPAIGIAAAYGALLAARQSSAHGEQWLTDELTYLQNARPTAVNLKWAVEKMRDILESDQGRDLDLLERVAGKIFSDDIDANRMMGDLGAQLIGNPCAVLTHCNAGSLATGGYGTALGVVRSAFVAGKITQVYADETRPWLQGARLTAWELRQDHIPVKLIADGAAAHLFKQGEVKWLIVGSDRIAANGDVANKIGTYTVAVAARYHGVKVMVVAPTSTIDLRTSSGDDIPIETRSEKEVTDFAGNSIASPDVGAWNPVFDVTPAELVDFIVTEKGVVASPDEKKIRTVMQS
ncbi:MAG: S-methyl-5-thioribose-1-phosphate isomerase [Gammaproteobacteria bacterium]